MRRRRRKSGAEGAFRFFGHGQFPRRRERPLILPLYFFGISRLVLEFIRKIDLRSDEYLFTVVTRGGSPGCALRALRKELEKKSKTLYAGFYVNFWTNYVLKYRAPSENRMRVKSMKARGRVEGIARVIEAKGRCHPSGIGAKDLAEFRDGGRLR